MSGIKRRRLMCSFGGGGGGAGGFKRSRAKLFGHEAEYELLGGFDKDAYACKAFVYLTGIEQVCIDAREITPAMMRAFYGEEAPWTIFGSPPCQGASKLLSTAKSKTAFYELLNELALVNLKLILEAWAPETMHNGELQTLDREARIRALEKLPAFFLWENVPNITSRAKKMVAELRRISKAVGLVIQDGFHECRHVGNLAQRRKRWFFLARNPVKVPAFVYLPPHKPGLVCGDVLNELPMPGDPAGGGMHVLPEISALNWWRLWAIPAGGDWRDLLPKDGTPRRARFRRHHIEKWTEPSVTIGGSGSNGPCAVADPRESVIAADPKQERFHHVDHVTPWTEETGTVTHAPAPSSGAIAVADPRFPGSLGVLSAHEPSGSVTCEAYPSTGAYSYADPRAILGMNLGDQAHLNLYRVTAETEPTGCVTGATRPGNGAPSYADPRLPEQPGKWFTGALGVLDPSEPSGAVTGGAGTTSGPFSYAAPVPLDLEPQHGNGGLHYDKYAVRPWNAEALTVHSATRVGSGAQSIAQPLAVKDSAFHEGAGLGRLGVLSPGSTASCVTGNARIATGPFSYAAPVPPPPEPLDLLPEETCYDKGYAVIDRNHEPSHTIAGNSFVGCGTYAITDDVPTPLELSLGCRARAGAYGVSPMQGVSPTVLASAGIDNSTAAIADPKLARSPFVVLGYEQAKLVADGIITAPFAIVDPERPNEPLAIVEDMAKPPFRWVETVGKGGKITRRKVVVPLVLISKDGTWHRPLTTLELAVLQGLPWKHLGRALDFGGGATRQRELIGNMVPMPVGEAFADQLLMAGLASDGGCFFLYGGGGGLWVRPDRLDELIRAGVRRVRQQDIDKIGRDEFVILDDEAPPIRRAPRSAKRRTGIDTISRLVGAHAAQAGPAEAPRVLM